MLIKWKKFFVLLSTLYLFTLIPWEASALERCENLRQQVRVSHYKYFGTDYPYHYSLGQLQQESNCRNVISRDGVGSEGPAQITYRVWKEALRKQQIYDVKSLDNNLKGQAYINYISHKQNPYHDLWVTYQIYNGGALVLKEIKRAGKLDWVLAKKACSRKIIKFKDGSTESACDINYYYSKNVYKYGLAYKTIEDGTTYNFWGK